MRNKLKIHLSTFLFLGVYFISVFLPGKLICANENINIDSLIKVKYINEKTILVSFGVDAITAIKTNEGIVVIDAGISTVLTLKYRKIIENKFDSNDFIYLINTHGHPDHTGGNSIFDDAIIIAHENCKKEIAKQWENPDKIKISLSKIVDEYKTKLESSAKGTSEWYDAFYQKTRYENAYTDALNNRKITTPEKEFSSTLDIKAGEITFHLMYFGKAHSESDILIFIPELRLLFSGDLFFPYGRPSLRNFDKENTSQCKKALDWLSSNLNKIDTIISGHGQIMNQEDLRSFIEIMIKNL